ncbi:hypothetical protein L0F63_004068, partial [Massospora cicadina]
MGQTCHILKECGLLPGETYLHENKPSNLSSTKMEEKMLLTIEPSLDGNYKAKISALEQQLLKGDLDDFCYAATSGPFFDGNGNATLSKWRG